MYSFKFLIIVEMKSAYKRVICTGIFIAAQFTVAKIGNQPDVHQWITG